MKTNCWSQPHWWASCWKSGWWSGALCCLSKELHCWVQLKGKLLACFLTCPRLALSWPLLSAGPSSQLALALLSCLGLGYCGTPPLSLATFHSWPLFGTASWSFGRTHLTTEEEHFLTEELMTSLQLFKSLKRCIHKNTSVFYYLRNSCATFRSSASNFPSSTAPQFWNCLKFHMLLPVKFPGY